MIDSKQCQQLCHQQAHILYKNFMLFCGMKFVPKVGLVDFISVF